MLRKVMLSMLLLLVLYLCDCENYSTSTAPQESFTSTTASSPSTSAFMPNPSTVPTEPGHIHSYLGQRVEPGCTTEGYLLHSCSCGDSFTDEVVPALGHGWGAWQTVQPATIENTGQQMRSCSRCDGKETRILDKLDPGHIHAYVFEAVSATCTQRGFTYHSCSCGDGYADSYVDALGHAISEYISNADATCTADGSRCGICTRCGITETIPDEGSALGHLWNEWAVEKEPTTTEEGLKTRKCDRCGASDSCILEKLPEEHTHQYKKEKIAATCTEGGYTLYVCECGESYREETSEAKGHTWGQWLVSIRPTTLSEGEKYRVCQDCGSKEWDKVEKLPGENSFVFVSWSEKVGRNEDAHVTIQGKPGVEYSITVFYKSGPSSAKGLEPKVADENGYVTWTWKVGGRTALGTFEIVVAGGGETRSIYFTIEE